MAIIVCPICKGAGCTTCNYAGQVDIQLTQIKKSVGISTFLAKLMEEPHDHFWALKNKKRNRSIFS
jgi:hypothetical protein